MTMSVLFNLIPSFAVNNYYKCLSLACHCMILSLGNSRCYWL